MFVLLCFALVRCVFGLMYIVATYINVDVGVSGGRFYAGATPSLSPAIYEAVYGINHPQHDVPIAQVLLQ